MRIPPNILGWKESIIHENNSDANLASYKGAARRHSQHVEDRRADDSADPEVTFSHEGADTVDEQLGARTGSRHEGSSSYVHPDVQAYETEDVSIIL